MKAKITTNGVEIEIVGSASEVASVLAEIVGTAPSRPALPSKVDSSEPIDLASGSTSKEGQTGDDSPARPIDALTLFKQKQPTNNREATAVAVFYATQVHGVVDSTGVTAEVLGDIFRQAQWKLPKRLDNTLVDTQKAGYLNRVERGAYELSNTGYNLVVHTLGGDDAAHA